MLTQTSELAIKALLVIGLESKAEPQPPKPLAQRLGCSPSYLAKVLGLLVKAGLLRSVRGAHGGVILARAPEDLTLLDIVEACQGLLIGNYCEEISEHKDPVCAFHTAMKEVHLATTKALKRWTLADIMAQPTPSSPQDNASCCKMAFAGCEKYFELSRKNHKPAHKQST